MKNQSSCFELFQVFLLADYDDLNLDFFQEKLFEVPVQFFFFLNETVHHFEVAVRFGLNCLIIVQFGHSFGSELNFAHPQLSPQVTASSLSQLSLSLFIHSKVNQLILRFLVPSPISCSRVSKLGISCYYFDIQKADIHPFMGTSVQVTPLCGVYNENPLSYLVSIDSFNILIDCGWNDHFDPSLLQPLSRLAVTLFLLSHSIITLLFTLGWL